MTEDRREPIDEPHLAATIDRLVADGELTAEDADPLRLALPEMVRQSAYILRHLGAHLTIGVIFAFDVIPLPLGSLSRGGWVVINRIYEEARRDRDRARVHSLIVLGVALVPFVGYFAYLIPLRASNADAAFLYANHVSYRRSGQSLKTSLSRKPRWMQRLVRWATSSDRAQP
ncbi:MAG: hypothetical protein SH850_15590 [Planctomycetaceae bacterium]|nr:hypothetical protein [Planctomycetaceae bacterium]